MVERGNNDAQTASLPWWEKGNNDAQTAPIPWRRGNNDAQTAPIPREKGVHNGVILSSVLGRKVCTTLIILLHPKENGPEGERNPLQRAVVHKECPHCQHPFHCWCSS